MVLPTIAAAGIYDSSIARKNITITNNRNVASFEIELPLENGGVSYINDKSAAIVKNMLICAKPKQIRHTKFPFRCYYVHFTLNKGELYDILINSSDFIYTTKYETYENIFKKLIKHYAIQSKTTAIIMQSLLLELIYVISQEAVANSTIIKTESEDLIIKSTIEYIKDNLTEDLSLHTIAKKMSFSPVYFHNRFRDVTGKTLHDFVEERRIRKAINLLQTTDYSLTRIAAECGFSSQSYFSSVFKRRMKTTPRNYIKQQYDLYQQ